jgi:hypothetical protein
LFKAEAEKAKDFKEDCLLWSCMVYKHMTLEKVGKNPGKMCQYSSEQWRKNERRQKGQRYCTVLAVLVGFTDYTTQLVILLPTPLVGITIIPYSRF